MSAYTNLHSQLASIMEALANAAVAEICQLVDDGFTGLRLEVSRYRRENLALKSRLRLMEVRGGPRPHREPVPPVLVTCTRTERFGEKLDAVVLKSSSQQKSPDQQSKLAGSPDQEVMVRTEPPDQEETARVGPSDQEAMVRTEPPDQEVMVRVEPPDQEAMVSAEPPDQEDMVRAEPMELEVLAVKKEVMEEDETSCSLQREDETAALSCSGATRSPHVAMAENVHVVNPHASTDCVPGCSEQQDLCSLDSSSGLYPLPAEDTVLSELNSEEKCTDWTPAIKLEAQPSWTQTFNTHEPLVCISNDCPSGTDAKGLPTGSEAAQMDSCSFDDLFSSPEVALSLTAPHKHSSFPFPSGSGRSSSSECSVSTQRSLGCQQCSRFFSTSRDLLVHQRSHTGERVYHCHLCGKPFLHPHQLKTHQRVHTGEKPFSCAQCGKRFSQSSHINRHMSVHTGEKRYSCSLCGKRFSQSCSLKVHQSVHTGERPYSCTKCGKSFSVLGNLVRHQSIHIGK